MKKILVIEDDQPLARGICFTLEKEDWKTVHCTTAAEGLQSARVEKPDLILLDVMLPDGNGFDLCKKIRGERQVPIIFLTACDEEINVVQGLDIGADDYITKPFRVKELVSRIHAVLRRCARQSETTIRPTIRSGEMELNLPEHKLYKQGREILLTPTEVDLVSVFMQNPNQVLTRNQILSGLWDVEGEFVDDNTLSVYIRRIREKLEACPSSPEYIITVRGFGYKWDRECE